MAYDNLCMYCFEDLGGHSTCPHCGRDSHAAVPQIQMLPGTLVYHDRFLIGRALGQDSSGIVYAAFDTKKENKLRIREYLPREYAERLNDGSVVPLAGKEDQYDAGIRKLRASVEEEQEPRKRHFFFEENGTAYIVQRKTAPAQPAEETRRHRRDDEEEPRRGRAVIIAIVAALAVVAAAAGLIFVFNGSLNNAKDVTETPTLNPNEVWVPAESPTVTPYASPTFAALVDPDLSWMDYTFEDASAAPVSTPNTGRTSGNTTRATAVGHRHPHPDAHRRAHPVGERLGPQHRQRQFLPRGDQAAPAEAGHAGLDALHRDHQPVRRDHPRGRAELPALHQRQLRAVLPAGRGRHRRSQDPAVALRD